MEKMLIGKRIAILVENGFEQGELTEPKEALEQAGGETYIISPQQGEIKGWQHTDWGDKFKVDIPLEEANAADYDGLLGPGAGRRFN